MRAHEFILNEGDLASTLTHAIGNTEGVHVSLENYSDYEVEIVNIEAIEKNKGYGSKSMDKIIDAADALGIDLMLIPAGRRKNDDRLVKFYEKFGFYVDSDGEVMRREARQ